MKLFRRLRPDILLALPKTAATKMEMEKDVSQEFWSLQVTAIF